jgi:hypothetical protein
MNRHNSFVFNRSHCDAVDHMRECVLAQDHTGRHMDSNGDTWEDGPLQDVLMKELQEDSLIFIKRKQSAYSIARAGRKIKG